MTASVTVAAARTARRGWGGGEKGWSLVSQIPHPTPPERCLTLVWDALPLPSSSDPPSPGKRLGLIFFPKREIRRKEGRGIPPKGWLQTSTRTDGSGRSPPPPFRQPGRTGLEHWSEPACLGVRGEGGPGINSSPCPLHFIEDALCGAEGVQKVGKQKRKPPKPALNGRAYQCRDCGIFLLKICPRLSGEETA